MTNLSRPGKDISSVEVTNISKHGLWLLVADQEVFLSFEEYPWFRDRSVAAIANVVEPSPGHFFWPDIDVDLSMEIIADPHQFPLVSNDGSPSER